MRSLAAQSAATLKVAVSGAAHVRLSPTGGRAKRVVSMGRSGGCEVGKGGRSSLGAGVRWLDGRKRAVVRPDGGPVFYDDPDGIRWILEQIYV